MCGVGFTPFRCNADRFCLMLVADVEEFYKQADPERENLCLYGESSSSLIMACGFYEVCPCLSELPDKWDSVPAPGETDGSWSVDLPAEEVPPELPEPCLGINFARDGMNKRDWLALVAVHSDSWLNAVAFYYGAKLDSQSR